MKVPYAATVRPDTGVSNGQLGSILLAAAETMLFGALFSSYVLLRAGAASWPHAADRLSLGVGWMQTIALVASSLFLGTRSFRRRGRTGTSADAGALVGCGALFLAGGALQWMSLLRAGDVPARDTFIALYFALTGVHGLGIAATMVAAIRARAKDVGSAGLVQVQWHVLVVWWLILFATIFLF